MPVAYGVNERQASTILENREDYPGVGVEPLPVRDYPAGALAAQDLGYVGEISPADLKSAQFKGAHPAYAAGDIVGKLGVERTYDRYLRGRPGIERVVVNALGEPTQTRRVQSERAGPDLVLSLDAKIQRETQRGLKSGLHAARNAGFLAPAGSAVVMDPRNGQILALASLPTYNPAIVADGLTTKEFNRLGAATPNNPDDDAFLNRPIQAAANPGSTFKVVTAGAAMATGVASPYTTLDCPGTITIPPQGGPGSVLYHDWTLADLGVMGFPESLEVSCDTYYYQLGYEMQTRFGVKGTSYWSGNKTDVPAGRELFQRYARTAGLGNPTGVDLPYESAGVVPDQQWCHEQYLATKNTSAPTCQFGWLPGYTVNMSIGQGDMRTTPLQMAVTYAAIANGGTVWAPKIGMSLERQQPDGTVKTLREFKPKAVAHLPLDSTELGVINQGLGEVISNPNGTAYPAFQGFPLSRYPIVGKTGTAEIGTSAFNDSWFVSYGPTPDPRYVIAVYVQKAGHGGDKRGPHRPSDMGVHLGDRQEPDGDPRTGPIGMRAEGIFGEAVDRIGGEPISARMARKAPARRSRSHAIAGDAAVVGLRCTDDLFRHRASTDHCRIDPYLKKQLIYMIVGFAVLLSVAMFDYRYLRTFAAFIYGGIILGLLIVLSPIGSTQLGATRWIDLGSFQVQPSELAKLGIIITLGAYLAERKGEVRARDVAICCAMVAVPAGLIFLEPDLGTALVFVAILGTLFLVAGAKIRHFLALGIVGLMVIVGSLHFGLVKQYQIDRFTAFLNPRPDVASIGYNLTQAKIAIASGGIQGKGLEGKNTQTSLNFVPEQHTDFIFTAVGEQLGFLGSATLLGLFALLIWRALRIATLSRDVVGDVVGLRNRRTVGVPDLRQRRNDHGHHADHRDPTAVHIVWRFELDHQLRIDRVSAQCAHEALLVSTAQRGSD